MSATSLKPGQYVMTITGPDGQPIYTQTVDMAMRHKLVAHMEDPYVYELLQVTSIAAGLVEGELMKLQPGGPQA